MSAEKTSKLKQLKGISVVLGALLCGIGLFSHFSSYWVKRIYIPNFSIDLRPYELCDIPGAEKCPDIAMERYFVAVIIITFVASVLSTLIKLETPMQQSIDKGYHILGAVLLIIGGIMYAISAQQIYDIFEVNTADGVNFRRWEKFISAALAFVQAILYCTIATRIGKR